MNPRWMAVARGDEPADLVAWVPKFAEIEDEIQAELIKRGNK